MIAGSLCTGYGGLDMAVAEVLGAEFVWHAEIDEAPARVLAHHYPGVPNLGDIKGAEWGSVAPVQLLTAGYPCQPFSDAGKRLAEDDPRHLWPYVARAVRVLRPRLVVLENVRGHLSRGFGAVVGELACLGYDARWVLLSAAAVGGPHLRNRVFIAATDAGREPVGEQSGRGSGQGRPGTAVAGHAGACAASDPDCVGHDRPGARRPGRAEPAHHGVDAAADPDLDELARQRRERPGREVAAGHRAVDWGDYRPAIERWAAVLGRPAPAPTIVGQRGQPKLSPFFVEWLMGLPAGHVTAPEIGLTVNQQLKALGNGVVPQQAAAALRWLLAPVEVSA